MTLVPHFINIQLQLNFLNITVTDFKIMEHSDDIRKLLWLKLQDFASYVATKVGFY